jgi:endonuclease/exonuclease/phosphatase family metal-dependent hydrolase
MRVVTFNAGLLDPLIPHAAERRDALAARLPSLGADIIALQEVWEEKDLEVLIAALGERYEALAADPLPDAPGDWAAGGRCGLAVFTRPGVRGDVIPLESWFVRRAAIRLDVPIAGGTLLVLASHLTADIPPIPHPEPGGWEAEHGRQVEALIAVAERHSGPAMVLGDLNCGPALPGIDAEFEAGYLRLLETFERSVFVDQGEAACTFCSENPLQPFPRSTLLDHVLVRGIEGPAVARRILDEPMIVAGIEIALSDHYGLLVEFPRL